MGDSVRIEGKADYVWGIQADGTFGAEFQANTGTVSTGSRRFSWYYLYSYLPDKGYGIINGPF